MEWRTRWRAAQRQNILKHKDRNSKMQLLFSKCEEREKNQKDATIICLLLTPVSTCFGHQYVHLQEKKDRVTAFGVLLCSAKCEESEKTKNMQQLYVYH
jgi:hypothetical protein